MGKVMGKVLSVVQRKANRFNIENRAAKIISKEKPTPAPLHPSTLREIEAIKTEHSGVLTELSKKDPTLDERLKKVYVQSHDPIIEQAPLADPTRPLPQERRQVEDFELGYWEPMTVPHGRFTLRQVLKFLTDHQADPNVWTAAAIAKEYKIDEGNMEKVLFRFRTFRVHIPDKKGGGKIEAKKNESSEQQLLEPEEKLKLK